MLHANSIVLCGNNWVVFLYTRAPFLVSRPVKQLSLEVVVGAQCGSAVLRGAHVFAPGIVASPKCKSQICRYFFPFSPKMFHMGSYMHQQHSANLKSNQHVMRLFVDMKAGDLVSVFSDLEGRCTRGAFSFQGKKVFVGNGVAEKDRSSIFCAGEPPR